MFRGYSRLCFQELLLMDLRDYMVCQGWSPSHRMQGKHPPRYAVVLASFIFLSGSTDLLIMLHKAWLCGTQPLENLGDSTTTSELWLFNSCHIWKRRCHTLQPIIGFSVWSLAERPQQKGALPSPLIISPIFRPRFTCSLLFS